MIKSVRWCLQKIIGQAKFSHDKLLTVITEVEMVLNSTPLSYVSTNDIEEPLTPSHLMIGRRLMSLPDYLDSCHGYEEFEATHNVLTTRATYLNTTMDRFWVRWRKEYLVELRESHRYHKGSSSALQMSVGDVIIIHNENQPWGFWKLGRIEETLTGPDGEIRGAVLRVSGRGGKTTLLHCPVQ